VPVTSKDSKEQTSACSALNGITVLEELRTQISEFTSCYIICTCPVLLFTYFS
jgi:hypothetical protein